MHSIGLVAPMYVGLSVLGKTGDQLVTFNPVTVVQSIFDDPRIRDGKSTRPYPYQEEEGSSRDSPKTYLRNFSKIFPWILLNIGSKTISKRFLFHKGNMRELGLSFLMILGPL